MSAYHHELTGHAAAWCKGTLLSTHFSNGISLPHNSGYIPSMQHLVFPTTSPVNHLFLNPTSSISPPCRLINRNLETHSEDLCTLFCCLSLLYLSPLLCYHHCSCYDFFLHTCLMHVFSFYFWFFTYMRRTHVIHFCQYIFSCNMRWRLHFHFHFLFTCCYLVA